MGLISRVSSRTYRSFSEKKCRSPPRDHKSPSTTNKAKPLAKSTPQLSSKPQSEATSSTSSTPTSERTPDRPPESKKSLVNRPPPNHGVPVEPLLESLESEVAEPTDPVKPLSVTCAEEVECSLHSKPGDDGTNDATSTNDDML